MKKGDLRICHYNIFSGGEKRIKNILDVIKEINPDICGILEAVGWRENIQKYKKLFKKNGYSFLYFSKSNTKYDIAVISKIKLKISKIKSGIWHSVIKIDLEEKNFPNVFYVHLDPRSEEERLKEFQIILKKLERSKTNIIMGDFNSLSPNDNYNKKVLLKKLKQNKVKKFGVKKIKFDVIKKIEKSGFVDIFKYLHKKFEPSTPTKFNTDINHKEKVRIDYAFIDKKHINKIKNCKVHKSKKTETASDHYPLYLDIKN
jgi:endonuclease/exonuclease/phosphatase family metal-dependent hydrolase